MRKKKSHKGLILLILIIVVCIGLYCYFNKDEEGKDTTTYTEVSVEKTTILNTISNSSSISSSLIENIELHATYYFEEIYVEENQYIAEGENILKYTNGIYLTAPYNCVITEISIPEEGEKCTNEHYITIESTDNLTMSLAVDEDELNTVYIGQEAQIQVNVIEDKIYTGYVTNISSTATYSSSGSQFTVTVEFQNDGNISIGMSATCNVILEKAEDVLAVPTEAIQTENKTQYVTVQKDDGTTEDITIETGISNDAYTEVTSGNLTEGQIILIYEDDSEEDTNSRGFDIQSGGTNMGDFTNDQEQGGGKMMDMDTTTQSMPQM